MNILTQSLCIRILCFFNPYRETAGYVFPELEKNNFEITVYFYHPEVHGRAEYKRRLGDIEKICKDKKIKLITPDYNIQEFFAPLMPFQDKNSIKYVSDPKRYRRKRCQLCISILLQKTAEEANKVKIKNFTTSMLCSPYRDHNEIWDQSEKKAAENNLNFFYKDFRKGYWKGRNFARTHKLVIPTYCGCSESMEEGILE